MDHLLHGGPIFDGEGDSLRRDAAILVSDAHIKAIGPLAELEKTAGDAQRIDVQGRTILPGLIDSHRHMVGQSGVDVTPELIASGAIYGVRVAQETLAAGITSVRDAGCKHHGIFALRRAIDEGIIPGPSIYATACNPTGSVAPQSWRNCYVSGPWSMREAVRQLKRDGADWIKLVADQALDEQGPQRFIRFLSDEEIRAAVEEAHALDMRISAHVEGLEIANAMVEAGADAIEHGRVIDERLAEIMAERGVYYVPTLWLFSTEPEWGSIPPHLLGVYEARIEEHKRSVERAIKAGVPIAAGTDWVEPVPPPDCLVAELEHLMAHGLDAPAALKAATANGARVMGKANEVGRLVPGLLADIIAVEGDPLTEIRALTRVDLVLRHGQVVKNRLPE